MMKHGKIVLMTSFIKMNVRCVLCFLIDMTLLQIPKNYPFLFRIWLNLGHILFGFGLVAFKATDSGDSFIEQNAAAEIIKMIPHIDLHKEIEYFTIHLDPKYFLEQRELEIKRMYG